MFDFGNESRISRIAYHLLEKVDRASRTPLLSHAVERGQALRGSQYLLSALSDEADKAAKGEGDALFTLAEVEQLKSVWRQRVTQLSVVESFIDHPALAVLLSAWRYWGGEDDAKIWWQNASQSDEGLLKLILAFASEVTSQAFGDYAVRVQLRVNPKSIQPYGDVQNMADRIQKLLDSGAVAAKYQAAAKRFIVECERMKEGKNPDAHDFDDD